MGRLWLILAVCGCARDLTAPDSTTEPAFLGDLSGYYRLVLEIPDYIETDGQGGEPRPGRDSAFIYASVPLSGRMKVMHLRSPRGGADPVVAHMAQGSANGVIGGTGTTAQSAEGLFAPGFDQVFLYGRLEGDRIEARDDRNDRNVTIRRIAGGGALTLESGISICPGGESYTAYATRVCEFNPALSGIFSATRSGCAGGAEQRLHLALGFSEQEMVGVGYPNTTQFMEGMYSRFDESGFVNMFDAAGTSWWTADWSGDYTLRESDGSLQLTGEVYGAEGECARIEATRLSGGTPASCNPEEDTEQTLGLWTEPEGSVLVVHVHTLADFGQRLQLDAGLSLVVRAAGVNLVPIDPPTAGADGIYPYSARYDTTGVTAAQLEVFAYYAGDELGRSAGWAVPACVARP